jgi:hypothetical protein
VELLTASRRLGYLPHPSRLVLTANAGKQFLEEHQRHRAPDQTRVEKLYREIVVLFEQALDACSNFPSEEKYNRLAVVTSYQLFLEDHAATAEHVQRVGQLEDEAWRLLRDQTPTAGVPGQWFERRGDEEPNRPAAAAIYVNGLLAAPRYGQNWVKYFGSCDADQDSAAYLALLTPEDAQTILRNATKGLGQFVPDEQAIRQRWLLGIDVFKRHWPRHRGIQSRVYEILDRFRNNPELSKAK